MEDSEIFMADPSRQLLETQTGQTFTNPSFGANIATCTNYETGSLLDTTPKFKSCGPQLVLSYPVYQTDQPVPTPMVIDHTKEIYLDVFSRDILYGPLTGDSFNYVVKRYEEQSSDFRQRKKKLWMK
jgi:hypothetical protein